MTDFGKLHNARVALANKIASDVVRLRKYDWRLYETYNNAVDIVKRGLAKWLQPFIVSGDIEDFAVDFTYDKSSICLHGMQQSFQHRLCQCHSLQSLIQEIRHEDN